jgi:hypothetical protein
MKEFQLGFVYKDKVTGFKGVALGHVRYLTGCNQVLLAPGLDKEGKVMESLWFDEQRLTQMASKQIVLDNSQTPGFDKPAPARH